MNIKTTKKLHKIKDFADTFGITTKTLKIYEVYDLFKPAYIDERTNYRFYTQEQIYDLSRILMLKGLGFSLKEIKDFLSGNNSIQSKINLLVTQRDLINSLIERVAIYATIDTNYIPKIKTIPAHHAYAIEYIAKNTDDIIERFSHFNDEMISSNLQLDKYIQAYAIFHDTEFKFTDISLTLCSVVTKEGKNTIYMPEKKVISILHLGDYETLINAYNFLFDYCKEHDFIICGDPIEYYLNGSGIKNITGTTLTEVCFPIE